MQPKNQDYDYTTSGFNDFLSRSIDGGIGQAQAAPVRQLNFDQNQITGSLGDKLKVGLILIDGTAGTIEVGDDNGNSPIIIDGKRSRISVFNNQSEIIRIGELDG